MSVVYNKIKFVTNIINVVGIHKFYFYNNKHIFTTKHIYFIKINTNS